MSRTRGSGDVSSLIAGIGAFAFLSLLARSCDAPSVSYEAIQYLNERPEIVSKENFTDALGTKYCRYELATGEAVLLRQGPDGYLQPITPETEFGVQDVDVYKKGVCTEETLSVNGESKIKSFTVSDDSVNIFVR